MDGEMQDYLRGLLEKRERRQEKLGRLQGAMMKALLDDVADALEALRQIPAEEMRAYEGVRQIREDIAELARQMEAWGL